MKHVFAIGAGAVMALAGAAFGQVSINEFLVNPPGTDNGFEFFEFRSTVPNFSLAGLSLIVIEAGAGTSNGTVDAVLNLNSFSTGSNGLFLWRDSAIAMSPATDPATTVNVADFAPDIENGGNSYLLVSNFSGSVGSDLDTNDDGVLELTPWASVLDAISYSEDSPNPVSPAYALQFGGLSFAQEEFGPDVFMRAFGDAWILDVLGNNPGPYTADPLETRSIGGLTSLPAGWTVTPGSDNNIPTPGALALAAIGGLVATRRRRA